MFGSLGWQELAIVLVIVIIIFGAGKLPEIGGALGRGIKEFKTATQDDDVVETPQQVSTPQQVAAPEQPAPITSTTTNKDAS